MQESKLQINFEAISEDTCICVTKSDSIGSVVIPAKGKGPEDCESCPKYSPVFLKLTNSSLQIPILYNQPTGDLISVQAANKQAKISGSLFVTIADTDCVSPQIVFVRPGFGDSSQPIIVEETRATTVKMKLSSSQCLSGKQYTINWTLSEVDQHTLNPIREIRLSDLYSPQTMTLIIPKGRLQPGIYVAKIQLTVQGTDTSVPTVLTQKIYLMRLYPPLVVQFDEGNPISMNVGLDEPEICLNPELHSYDPSIGNRLMSQVSKRFTQTSEFITCNW